MNINIIVGNNQPPETLSKNVKKWRISRGRLASHLIFFNRISYYSGYAPKEVIDQIRSNPRSLATSRLIAPYWKLSLPSDPALDTPELGLIVPFFSSDPYVSMARAVVEKMEDGYEQIRGERWVCHPSILKTDAAAINSHPFAPSINVKFLDGILCPPDNVPLEEVIAFREKRSSERQAFFDALYRHCEAIEIEGKKLSVNVDPKKIEKALQDLNRSMPQRWISGIRRSLSFEVRPTQATIVALIPALTAFATGNDVAPLITTALSSAIVCGVSLTPRLKNENDFTKAMGFVLDAKSTFAR